MEEGATMVSLPLAFLSKLLAYAECFSDKMSFLNVEVGFGLGFVCGQLKTKG